MNNFIIITIIKCIIIYILALFVSKLMGSKILSQTTLFDFIIAISMGSLIGVAVSTSCGDKFITAIIALFTFTFLEILTGYIHIKHFKLRKFLNAQPVTLIENGEILNLNMKKIKLTLNELMMKLREKTVFNINDVQMAILESDGTLSVLLKSEKQSITREDLNIESSKSTLTKDLIIDGTIIYETLKNADLNENWLSTELQNYGINNINEVFYAGLDSSKKLYISKKKRF
ncbi:DUF421 domain-containing protein [Inconstantimicrobium mannanitabidum]|uniref:DUF421 domain-containing protein n=1 Tax=Inconstantimicrobium mannanitabidum TaxID=1604901 RepID=A0ACB5RFU9_9CLOT|nr:DUF421 domain-containing protein [Clostridium sp. TW13]GKX67966.1 DUF421 domain-containing protein [Clostridium sp. TW13]